MTLSIGNIKGDLLRMEQKLVTIISMLSVMISSSMDRPCLKDINEGMINAEQVLFEKTEKTSKMELEMIGQENGFKRNTLLDVQRKLAKI